MIVVTTLSVVGFGAGVRQWTRGNYMVGFAATSVCLTSFLVSLI